MVTNVSDHGSLSLCVHPQVQPQSLAHQASISVHPAYPDLTIREISRSLCSYDLLRLGSKAIGGYEYSVRQQWGTMKDREDVCLPHHYQAWEYLEKEACAVSAPFLPCRYKQPSDDLAAACLGLSLLLLLYIFAEE